MRLLLAAPALLLITACEIRRTGEDGTAAPAASSPDAAAKLAPAPPAPARRVELAPPAIRTDAARPAPASAAPQTADLAPCPGINPDIRRPPGSNCLGILPQACGADRVVALVGAPANAATLDSIRQRIGHDRIRIFARGEPVTDDLRPDRLNIEIGARGRIAGIDCY